MQNTERQKFEENWKSAFDGAEMSPSDSVWNSIEVDLAGQESAAMKKRVIFYQRLAAATIIFALLTGTYAFYINYSSSNNGGKGETQQAVNNNSKPIENKAVEKETIAKKEIEVEKPAASIQLAIAEKQKEEDKKETFTEPVSQSIREEESIEVKKDSKESLEPKEAKESKETVVSPLLQTAPLTASLEEQKSPEEVIEKKRGTESTWLALGAAAGNYSHSAGGGGSAANADMIAYDKSYANSPSVALAEAAVNSNKAKVGSSYTIGVGVGKKFGRFVIQSGVNLGKQEIDYTSTYDTRTAANSTRASASFYSMADNTFNTAPYTVNSSMQIVSIPVQAGYMIVDRRLGWQMNAGFSPDFFLKNTLVDKSGQRQRFSQGAGESSPYRSVNWSGLLNTELSYRIGNHYRISLVPGVRYSFTSILKDNTTAKPLILDVGFRFRYLFE